MWGYTCTQNVVHDRFGLQTSVELQTACSATWHGGDIKVCCTVTQPYGRRMKVDAQQQSTAFPQPLSATLTQSPRHYVHNPVTKFHSNRTINVESTATNSFTPVSKWQLSLGQFS